MQKMASLIPGYEYDIFNITFRDTTKAIDGKSNLGIEIDPDHNRPE